MVYDDLIIGSGLTALAVACGLPPGRRVCVVAGPKNHELQYYDEFSGIPCANQGNGGLGSYWHGVIPMGKPDAFYDADLATVAELFRYFYPESIENRLGTCWQFVPYQPIRPMPHWRRMLKKNPNWLWVAANADRVERKLGCWSISVEGRFYRASRVWVAAGALGTPSLLDRTPELSGCARKHVSDHVILYLGQLNRRNHPSVPCPVIERAVSGVWMSGHYDARGDALITTKPARFSYACLDHGIEQRAAFGLPTTSLLGKLARAPSLGLIAESLFNKFGLFPRSEVLSAYAQICIKDAYQVSYQPMLLVPEVENIRHAIKDYRDTFDWPALQPSLRPDLYIRGIHLHHSLNMGVVEKSGILDDGSLSIVDPSFVSDIGPEHHTFKAMVRAYSLARSS